MATDTFTQYSIIQALENEVSHGSSPLYAHIQVTSRAVKF